VITIAIPKGRLQSDIAEYCGARGIACEFEGRQLVTEDTERGVRWILVKNSDVPLYVASGIAALGIVGSDILDESHQHVFRHIVFPFGQAKLCLINKKDSAHNELHNGIKIASKYVAASKRYLAQLGISGSIYFLHGSLELAPLLGLAPFIIDIVQSGATIASNNLKICAEIAATHVYLISNPAYYKIYHEYVDTLINTLQ